MKKLLAMALGPFAYILSITIPKKKNKWVYGAWFGKKYADNSKYLFEYRSSLNKGRNIWISKDQSIIERIRSNRREAYHAYSLRGIYHQITAELMICCVNSRDFNFFTCGGQRLVQLWHGLPMKKIGFDVKSSTIVKIKNIIRAVTIDNYRLIASPSPFFDPIFKSAFRSVRIFRAPMSRCDGLAADPDTISKIQTVILRRKKMEHEILGLYLPTHRDEGQTINRVRKNIEIMDRILHKLNKDQSRKVLMFYRLHPYDEHLGEQIPKYRYVFRTPEFIDSYELMASVDFLVSDYSSVIFDFAYLRRPIIGFIPDEREYKEKCRDLYLKPSDVYETCCHCEEELSRALQYVTNNTDNNVSICGINPKIFLPSQRAGTLCCMTLNAIEKELS